MKAQHEDRIKLIKTLFALPVFAATAWIAYSKLIIDHDQPLLEAIPAKRVVFKSKTNVNINYYQDQKGEGDPLVLIHGIHPAASALDLRPLFEYYRHDRPVYAVELPGFGFSERPLRQYTAQYFVESILNFMETQIAGPADVLAIGKSSEFAARSAIALPEYFRSLTLLSPTGFEGQAVKIRKGRGDFKKSLASLLSNPLWSQAIFDLKSSRFLLEKRYQNKFVNPIPEDYYPYAYATTHQLGAQFAPFAAAAGQLETRDILDRFYKRLELPVQVIYDGDPFLGYDQLPSLLNSQANWHGVRIPASNGMPQFDRLAEIVEILEEFWQK